MIHRTDQEQRVKVMAQFQIMSIVPLPLGCDVHPCLGRILSLLVLAFVEMSGAAGGTMAGTDTAKVRTIVKRLKRNDMTC